MLVDLSVKVSKTASGNALDNEKMASFGHLGTHFDVMNKEFPLEFIQCFPETGNCFFQVIDGFLQFCDGPVFFI